MCTIIPKTSVNRPKTAKKDIVVYKGCDRIWGDDKYDKVSAHYQSFTYIKDKLNTTKLHYSLSENCASDAIEGDYKDSLDNYVAITRGFHAFCKLDPIRLRWCGVTCEFVIPKGSKYHVNPVGNIVSNQIIFKKIL